MATVNREYRAVGINYYMQAIDKLKSTNPDYKLREAGFKKIGAGKRVYHYNYINKPAYLIPEPTNAHDRNAIYIQIAGEKVGYISRAENTELLALMKSGPITYLTAFIGGGEYKVLTDNGELLKGASELFVNVRVSIQVPDGAVPMRAPVQPVVKASGGAGAWFKKHWKILVTALGAIMLIGGIGNFGVDNGAAIFGVVVGVGLIGWIVADYFLRRSKAQKLQQAVQQAAAEAVHRCPNCGAVTKGTVCEYCGAPINP